MIGQDLINEIIKNKLEKVELPLSLSELLTLSKKCECGNTLDTDNNQEINSGMCQTCLDDAQ